MKRTYVNIYTHCSAILGIPMSKIHYKSRILIPSILSLVPSTSHSKYNSHSFLNKQVSILELLLHWTLVVRIFFSTLSCFCYCRTFVLCTVTCTNLVFQRINYGLFSIVLNMFIVLLSTFFTQWTI